jgi:hypothetical protein
MYVYIIFYTYIFFYSAFCLNTQTIILVLKYGSKENDLHIVYFATLYPSKSFKTFIVLKNILVNARGHLLFFFLQVAMRYMI